MFLHPQQQMYRLSKLFISKALNKNNVFDVTCKKYGNKPPSFFQSPCACNPSYDDDSAIDPSLRDKDTSILRRAVSTSQQSSLIYSAVSMAMFR